MADHDALTTTLVQLADNLVEDFDVVDILTLLVDRAVEILEISAAGVMLVDPASELRLLASSSEAMRVLELFELQADEGPCLDCHRTGEPILDVDLAAPHDWPTFAPAAIEAGFRVVHAVPMRLRGTVIGALNLFSDAADRPGRFDVVAGQALADMATISILQHRASVEAQTVTEQLRSALTSRIIIEQAKGVLFERAAIDMEEAFARLRRYARNNNRRLAEVAEALIEGTLTADDFAALP